MPSTRLDPGTMAPTLTQLLTEVGMVTSGKQVKDALANGAVFINGVPVEGAPPVATESCFQAETPCMTGTG